MTRWESRQQAHRLRVDQVHAPKPRLYERALAWLLRKRYRREEDPR